MRKMKNLIKTQLKYFATPSTFILGILFTVFTYANFFIRQRFFSGNSSSLVLFFNAVPYISIIAVPALCSKTSINYYDDFIPVSRLKKLFSQFFVILAVYTVFLICLIPALILISFFCTIDAGQIFTGFLCLIFYGSCIISLCLFIGKVFSSSSILSFVFSAVLLSILNSAHNFSLYIGTGKFFSAVFRQLSFAWHFDAASKAILDSRDFIFLTAFSVIFILLAACVEEKKAGKNYSKTQSFRLFSTISILVLLISNGNRFYFRSDFSKDKLFSVSKYTKNLLRSVDESINITFYRSGTLSRLYPQLRDVTDFLQVYSSQNSKISFSVKNPDGNEKLSALLENYGIQSQPLKTGGSNSSQYINVYSAVVIEYGGSFKAIPFTMTAQTLEYDMNIRLKALLNGKDNVVNIILGNGMDYTNDYSYLAPFLAAQGIICNPIFIQEADFSKRLEAVSGPLLVIGDSQINIDKAVAIENYILSGKGNGFFAVSPYSADIYGDWTISQNRYTNIVEMLENWGIQFEDKLCADISCARITMVSSDEATSLIDATSSANYTQTLNYPLWVKLLNQQNAPSGLTLYWPVSIKINNEETAKPYLLTTSQAYTVDILRNSEKNVETNPFELQNQSTAGKEKKSLIPGVIIEGKLSGLFNSGSIEDGRVIAISDPYFVNTLMMNYSNTEEQADYSNFDFLTNVLLKLSDEPELAALQGRQVQSYSGFKISDAITFSKLAYTSIFILFIAIPLILILTAVIYFKLRKPEEII